MTTTLTMSPEVEHEIAQTAEATAADRLAITKADVQRFLKLSVWNDARGMLRQEFSGTYRGYVPTCGTNLMAEAVVAEVFDALAVATGDPRRALRRGGGGRHG